MVWSLLTSVIWPSRTLTWLGTCTNGASAAATTARASPRGRFSRRTIPWKSSVVRAWSRARMASVSSARDASSVAITGLLCRVEPDHLVEAAEADEERGVHRELDQLALRELLAQLRPQRVVDLLVIHGQLLGEAHGGALPRAQQRGRLVVDRLHLGFRQSGMPGPGIADLQSVATGVEGGDLQAHELAEHRVERALLGERGAEPGEGLERRRVLAIGAWAGRGAGLALGVLADVAELRVDDLVRRERLDPGHGDLLRAGLAGL